jgi:hypothetical protein
MQRTHNQENMFSNLDTGWNLGTEIDQTKKVANWVGQGCSFKNRSIEFSSKTG